jgi:CRISPR-associated protein Cas2
MYDIRDEKRLKQTAKIIEGYGVRIQYSVFKCNLNKRELERLHWELSKILRKEDSLISIGLCESCTKMVRAKNKDRNEEDISTDLRYEIEPTFVPIEDVYFYN